MIETAKSINENITQPLGNIGGTLGELGGLQSNSAVNRIQSLAKLVELIIAGAG